MLSYQHAYHAGSPADLHKHIVLAELLARLTAKTRPLTYVETHAGRGLYDLGAAEALKTGEAARGVGRVEVRPETPFGRAVAAARCRHGPGAYPGSPLIARALLRPQDRLVLHELHPAEHAALKAAVRGDGPPVAVHRRDGFEGALALAPPKPPRGLVLVDPSYEVKAEYEAAASFVRRLVAKWPQAVVLVWHPILAAGRHEALAAGLSPLPYLRDEVEIVGADRGMTGSGLLLVNGPYRAAEAFRAAHAQAADAIAPAAPARRPRQSR
jgi:23S rRNA (adenine2030-N6)-methyltransferase